MATWAAQDNATNGPNTKLDASSEHPQERQAHRSQELSFGELQRIFINIAAISKMRIPLCFPAR
jgi:hypothetical protein